MYIKKLFRNSKVAYKNEKKNSKRRKISYDAKEENNVMELLLRPTALEKEKSQLHDDINELLSRPSAKVNGCSKKNKLIADNFYFVRNKF